MSLSEMEKETVIQFDESTNLATVYTASWTVARSLKKAGYQPVKKHKVVGGLRSRSMESAFKVKKKRLKLDNQ